MEKLIEKLRNIGLPEREIQRVTAFYRDDLEGLREYTLYLVAILDDRHEYV